MDCPRPAGWSKETRTAPGVNGNIRISLGVLSRDVIRDRVALGDAGTKGELILVAAEGGRLGAVVRTAVDLPIQNRQARAGGRDA